MRKLYSTLILFFSAITTMAQGWPENYNGVMLQGFYWDSFADTQWTRLEKQADDLSKVFDLVWIPQSGKSTYNPSMGYDPLYWFTDYNSSFGTEEELRSLIKTFKAKGIGTIADVVINHRGTLTTWNDFPTEKYKNVDYTLTYEDICSDDEAAGKGYQVGKNKDTGEKWDGLRDLDHKSENVQTIVKAYLNFLLNDLGYTGFRYDMVKGYSAEFTKMYNEDSKPQFSVGEYWDSSKKIKNWIDGTDKTSAAFDFQFKYVVRNATDKADWTLLGKNNENNNDNWPLISNQVDNGNYRQYAITFVENHDTEVRPDGSSQGPLRKDTLAANAYLLAMPGTPCVFLKHWKAYKQEIANMITVRKALGITNTSATENIASDKTYYAVQTTGSKGKLLAVVGTKAESYQPEGSEWKKAVSGYHYVYFVSGIDPTAINYPEINTEDEKDGEYAGVPTFCTMEEGDRCAFFEAPASWGSQIFVWAWMNGGEGEDYLGTSWPGVTATKLDTADNGNSVWKWDVTGTTNPDNIIFSGGGAQTDNMKFTNGGYYFGKEGLKATVTATAIRNITAQTDGETKVYTLDGRLIRTAPSIQEALNGLPKGIYIINNKKFVIR